jgi:hypothetical protein
MNNRIITGVFLGATAGIVDLIPMFIQKLTFDADISAFSMWLVIGFLVSVAHINVKPFLKGIILSFAVLLPSAVIIGWHEPLSLIPISIMTLILGGLLGVTFDIITA